MLLHYIFDKIIRSHNEANTVSMNVTYYGLLLHKYCILLGVKHKVESTPHVEGNTKDLTSTPSLMSKTDQLSILTVVGITTGALLSIGVVSNVVCFLFLCRYTKLKQNQWFVVVQVL